VDLCVRLGQRVSFAGTANPFYETLGATLLEVVHDFVEGRTELVLSSERRLGSVPGWGEQWRRLAAEHDQRNLESEVKLLRRAVGKRHPVLFDGDRDARAGACPGEPVTSVGKLGGVGLTGAVRLEEDDGTTPSILISTVGENNSLRLSANVSGEAEDVGDVSLGEADAGDTGRLADAGHRHVLGFDETLRAAGGGGTLGHALKEAFTGDVQVQGYLSITWDSTFGHVLNVTTMGS